MSKKIFACVKCGQVYYSSPPNKCLKISSGLFGQLKECDSTEFEEIAEEDVLDIHDVIPFLIEKLFGIKL